MHPDAADAPLVTVATFYRFVTLSDPAALRLALLDRCGSTALRGTILLATEGINASLAGSRDALEAVLAYLRTQAGLHDLTARFSICNKTPFRRLKVRLRHEIVSMGIDGVSPEAGSGTLVAPRDWNALLADPEVLLLDVRNDYEHRIGTFRDAQAPGTQHFREFPAFVRQQLRAQAPRKVAMFCTGGIRCEKASAYLLQEGIEQVYQLDGGILNYIENTPHEESLWQGDCFVFDDRVALNERLEQADFEQCHGCRRPLSAQDRESALYEPGIACAACHGELSDIQRRAFAERKRQVVLAAARDREHIGARMPGREDEAT